MIKQMPNKQEASAIIEKFNEKHIFSRFNFLKDMNGLKKGCLYGLLATSGAGKSTLLKTIIGDTSISTKTLVWLSEESRHEYSIGLLPVTPINRNNVFFFEESDAMREIEDFGRDHEKKFSIFKNAVFDSGCEVIFFDNLTTSSLYGDSVFQQNAFFARMKQFANEMNIAIFYLLHTDSTITENHGRLIEGENVRGSRQPFNKANYFFILQRLTVHGRIFSFLRVRKCRQGDSQGKFYGLTYKDFHYEMDCEIKFEDIKNAFKNCQKI